MVDLIHGVCYRRDAGAHSGHLSNDHREAEVPHTETPSHTEVSSDAQDTDNAPVVPLQPDSQQSQSNVTYITICKWVCKNCP